MNKYAKVAVGSDNEYGTSSTETKKQRFHKFPFKTYSPPPPFSRETVVVVFNNSHGIGLANYHNHYIMAFDLTSTQEASRDLIHPELTNCTISVELKFDAPLGENVELLFMGERASTVYVRSDRNIAKTNLMN